MLRGSRGEPLTPLADIRPMRWAVAHIPLEDPDDVARLLRHPRQAAHEQAAALAGRDPATHVSLRNPGGVARLLRELREACAHEQAAALARQLPGQACSRTSASTRTPRIGSGFGREADGRPARPWDWEDLD